MTPEDPAAAGAHGQDGAVKRNPVPSLLRSLLTDHLDPGYADEARLRVAGERAASSRRAAISWLVAGTMAIGLIFGISAAHESHRTPDTVKVQRQIAEDVRAQQSGNKALAEERDGLAQREARERRVSLLGDGEGGRVLSDLNSAEVAAAAVAMTGPGIRVSIREQPPRSDLSDGGRPVGQDRGQVILDRDLQAVVNGLWSSGAEAVAIGGVRIGPGVSIRQAGGAILVDNQPVYNPYVVEAIGDAGAMQAAYIVSPAYLRMQSLQQLYGASVDVETVDSLQLAEAPIRDLQYARGD